jgi:hypothetical protein
VIADIAVVKGWKGRFGISLTALEALADRKLNGSPTGRLLACWLSCIAGGARIVGEFAFERQRAARHAGQGRNDTKDQMKAGNESCCVPTVHAKHHEAHDLK